MWHAAEYICNVPLLFDESATLLSNFFVTLSFALAAQLETIFILLFPRSIFVRLHPVAIREWHSKRTKAFLCFPSEKFMCNLHRTLRKLNV